MTVNPYQYETGIYNRVRPAYPSEIIELIQRACVRERPSSTVHIADIGAGTGKMTRLLAAVPDSHVYAIEPAVVMRDALNAETLPCVTVSEGCAEATGLRTDSINAAVFAQSWHWCDPDATSAELARILDSNGSVHIVWNQLDVSIPWVKRLTRIMRSGDVHRADKPPLLGPDFTRPQLTEVIWNEQMTLTDILALARTRSSYLRANATYRAKMQTNLRWYLHDHLGISDTTTVSLPYRSLYWRSYLVR